MIRLGWTVLPSVPRAVPPPRADRERAAAPPLWDEDRPPRPTPAGDAAGPEGAAPPGLSLEAYLAVVDRWHRGLLHYLCRLCGQRQQAEDLLQETFLLAWERRTAFRDPGAVRSWLFTVAGNLHRQQHRRDPRPGARQLVALSADLVAPDAPPWSDSLQRALAELSADDRQVLLLVAVQGFTLPEAAALLGVGEAAATKRWQRARYRLADALGRQDGDLRGEGRQAGVAGRKDAAG